MTSFLLTCLLIAAASISNSTPAGRVEESVVGGEYSQAEEDEEEERVAVRDAVLREHNLHRENAGLDALEWDQQLERLAIDQSTKLGEQEDCAKMLHRDWGKGRKFGENMYMEFGKGTNRSLIAQSACKLWYSELRHYQYPGEENYQACGSVHNLTGHFTQMMWAKTTGVGCGLHICNTEWAVFTCYYRPRGNRPGSVLFPVENFLQLCGEETGWTSCDDSLQADCDRIGATARPSFRSAWLNDCHPESETGSLLVMFMAILIATNSN